MSTSAHTIGKTTGKRLDPRAFCYENGKRITATAAQIEVNDAFRQWEMRRGVKPLGRPLKVRNEQCTSW